MGILPALMRTCAGRHRILPLLLLPLALVGHVPRALSQTGEGGWTGQANLSLAGSYGNAGSGSLGLSAETERETDRLRLILEGGLLRTSTDTVTRQAFGGPDLFSVERTVMSHTSADRTHLRARVSQPSPEGGGTGLGFFAAAGWTGRVPLRCEPGT